MAEEELHLDDVVLGAVLADESAELLEVECLEIVPAANEFLEHASKGFGIPRVSAIEDGHFACIVE